MMRPPRAARRPLVGVQSEEAVMRKYIDCREVPSESHCTIAISADSEDELVEAAVQHAVAVHHHDDTPELRAMLKQGIHEGQPAA
jgi:predicted small metal-binding protein